MVKLTYTSPIDFRIGQSPPQDEKVAIQDLYASIQQIARGLVQFAGIGGYNKDYWTLLNQAGPGDLILSGQQDKVYVPATDAMVPNRLVNLWSNAGVLSARYANATNNTKPADGYLSSSNDTAIAIGDIVEVVLARGTLAVTAVIGQRYWLSTTNGLIQTTKPVAAGNIEQYIGVGLTTGLVYLNTQAWIQH